MFSARSLYRQALKLTLDNNNLIHFRNVLSLSVVKRHNLKAEKSIFKRFSHNKPLKCWQCGIEKQNIAELFCNKCNYIQSPSEKKNFFKIIEIEENFNIDPKTLTQKYRQLQSVLHPDKFSNKTAEEKLISEDFSALVNKAYDVLQSPLKRAIHLLALKGENIAESQKIDEPDFLMQIMELNEEVENADSDDKLRILLAKNKSELEKIVADIDTNFRGDNLVKVKESVIKMKYYESVNAHINKIMREKGVVD